MAVTTGEERRHLMLEEPVYKVVLTLAIPSVIAMIVDSIYNLADTYFVSWIGESATAAVAINDTFMHLLLAISAGFGFGAGSCISRLLGAKENKHASEIASTTMASALIVCAVVIVTLFPMRDKVVYFFGATEDTFPYSMDYVKWILLAFPFTTLTTLLNNYHKSEGNSRYAMIGTVSGCIINCILDPIFIHVLKMEVEGASLATAISKVISATILLVPYLRKTTIITIAFKNATMRIEDIISVLKVGFPTFLRMSLTNIGGIITNNIAKNYGSAVLAGISIANKIYRIIASILMGFSHGLSPIIGYCWGAKRYSRVKEAYFVTLKIGVIICFVLGASLFIFAAPIINAFNGTNNEIVTQIGVTKLRILCLGLLPHILTVVTDSSYQALGKVIENLVLGMSRQVIFLIPLLLILPKYFNEYGLAYAQGTADIASGVLLGLPLAISLLKRISKCKDGEPATI